MGCLPWLFETEEVASAEGDHVKFEGEVVGDGFLEVGFTGYLVVEIVEGVEPFVAVFDGGFDHEFAGGFGVVEVAVEKALFFVFG